VIDELYVAMRAALTDERWDDFNRLADEADEQQRAREARLTSPEALAGGALWYARNGIAVFPITPRGKQPLFPAVHPRDSPERATCKGECGKPGHGLHDATTDVDTVIGWWAANPRANIGLRTGIRFDVIDIDGPTGYASYLDLRDAGQLPAVLAWSRTPGNRHEERPPGSHLYVGVSGNGNTAGFRPGLDYRGANGYVLAPPSVGPDGDRYDWITPLDVTALAAAQ
jgi:hypothetical protein